MYSEKCPRCWGIIEYNEHFESVKCPYCGDVVLIADFVSKRVELEEAKQKSEQAETELKAKNEQLENLNKQKEQLQDQLNKSHSALSMILSSQEESAEKLGEMLTAMVTEEEERRNMTGLLSAIRSEQKTEQNTLAHLLQVLTRSQDSAEGKLNTLAETAGKILNAQNSMQDMIVLQQEVMMHLQTLKLDGAERVTLLRDFFNWSMSIHEKDIKRLQQIQGSAESLQKSQNQQLKLLSDLKKEADSILNSIEETKSSIDSFRQAWDTANLDKLNMLYKEANDHMFDRNFDKAEKSFRRILVEGGEDAEVYWRILLCHYCVEYQKDENNRYIPIILNPDLSDPDTMSDRKNLFSIVKTEEKLQEYKKKVKEIDSILDKYREVRHRVEYDVFISVKQRYDGHITDDSDKASELYDELRKTGLRVFNSRRTPIPLGEEYEPYIISALMSAKVLIVVGSKAEFMEAQWVKNEWSRFQWMQRHEKAAKRTTERTLFCYLTGSMRPEKMPRALNPDLQAIKEGPSALGNIHESLKRIFPEVYNHGVTPEPPDDLEQTLRQMEFWLQMERYEEVRKKHESLTSSGKHLGVAVVHLYALCAKFKISEIEELKNIDADLEKERLFKYARKINKDEKLRAQMNEWVEVNRRRRKPSYPDGRVYQDGITEGNGIITWPDGSRYVGEILHGARSGQGKMTWADGNWYEGEWKEDKKNGKGKLAQKKDGFVKIQEGEWINDVLDVVIHEWDPGRNNGNAHPDGRVYQDNIRNGYGIIIWPNGDRYEGNIVNGMRSGNGTLRMSNGCTYTGLWAMDNKNFSGVYIWPDGQRYEGDFRDDKRNGKGVMTWPKGARYEGGWQNNVRHGKAIFREQSGNEYDTVWENGKLVSYSDLKYLSKHKDGRIYENQLTEGTGVITWPNGERYEGNILHGDRSGKGKMKYPNGNEYTGDWLNDKAHGRGVYLWADGNRYEGDYQNGFREGKGRYQFSDGRIYNGEWKESKRHGNGILTWSNGDRYEGEWKNDQRNGKGKLIFADGRKYDGQWKDGKKHGQGVFTWPDGQRYDGEWQKDKRHGKALYTDCSGKVFDTEWKDDKKVSSVNWKPNFQLNAYEDGRVFKNNIMDGSGVITWPSGDQYVGNILHGARSGKGMMRLADGREYTGDWLDDKFHGYGVYTWPDGNLYEGEWLNGIRAGKGKMRFANGHVYDGQFKDGKFNGYGVYTWSDGERFEGTWHNGTRNGSGKALMADGRVYDGEWKDDKKHGHGVFTWPNGERYDGEWQNDMRHGKAIVTDCSGKQFDTQWQNDNKISSIDRKPVKEDDFDEALMIFVRALGNKPIRAEQLQAFCRVSNAFERWKISALEAEKRLEEVYKASGISQQEVMASKRNKAKYHIENYNTYLMNLEAHYKSLKQERMTKEQIKAFIDFYELEKHYKIDVATVEKDLRDIYAKKNSISNSSFDEALMIFVRALGNKPICAEQLQAFCRVSNAFERWKISYLEAERRLEEVYKACGISQQEVMASKRNKAKYHIENYNTYLMNLEAHYKSLKQERMTKEQINAFIDFYGLEKHYKIDVATVEKDLQDIYAKKNSILKDTSKEIADDSNRSAKQTIQSEVTREKTWSYEDAMKAFIRALGNKAIQVEQLHAFFRVCDAYTRWKISLPEAERRLEKIYSECGIRAGTMRTGLFRGKYRVDSYEKYLLNLKAHYYSLNRTMLTDQQIKDFISCYELDKKLKIDVQTVKMDLREFRTNNI